MAIIATQGQRLLIEFANKRALALMHSKMDQPLGESVADILPEVLSESVRHKILADCFGRGKSFTIIEKEITNFIGGELQTQWFDITIQPVTDDEGLVGGAILFFAEVSSQVMIRKSKGRGELLQQLIDSSVELVAVIDQDLKFLAVNEAFEKFVDKSRLDLVGKPIFEAYQGAKGSRQVELLKKALAGERLHLKANPSISRPTDVWFDTHYVPLIIDKKVEGVIILSRDITDIIKSEQALFNVNRQFAEAQRVSKLGSWEWDINTGAIVWSDEMYRIYGYDQKFPVDFEKATERMSTDETERSSRRTQEHIRKAIENYNATKEVSYEIPPVEFAIKLPNGEQKLLRNSGKLELTAEGKLYRILGVVQDVTEIRAAEEKLRLLVDELESKNKDLESFNYVASHDLQEPLRKIQTFIDRIKSRPLSQEVIEDYLKRIDNAAKRMTELIRSVLALSQLSKYEDQFTNVDLNTVVDGCKSDFELIIREKNAMIECEKLPVIHASDFQMRQLFNNLISNALKFSNGKTLINISCKRVSLENPSPLNQPAKEYWCLTFKDNGIGFEPDYKHKIFELFQRLHPKHEYNGTGIGLSIVKRIVERHHGFVEASSEVGKGASFLIFLPIDVQF